MVVEAMRFGVRQAFAVGYAHYSNLDLRAMGLGFPDVYTNEELDAIEEASPFTSTLANGLKDDVAFPFPLVPK